MILFGRRRRLARKLESVDQHWRRAKRVLEETRQVVQVKAMPELLERVDRRIEREHVGLLQLAGRTPEAIVTETGLSARRVAEILSGLEAQEKAPAEGAGAHDVDG